MWWSILKFYWKQINFCFLLLVYSDTSGFGMSHWDCIHFACSVRFICDQFSGLNCFQFCQVILRSIDCSFLASDCAVFMLQKVKKWIYWMQGTYCVFLWLFTIYQTHQNLSFLHGQNIQLAFCFSHTALFWSLHCDLTASQLWRCTCIFCASHNRMILHHCHLSHKQKDADTPTLLLIKCKYACLLDSFCKLSHDMHRPFLWHILICNAHTGKMVVLFWS